VHLLDGVLHEHTQIMVSAGGLSLAQHSPQPVAPLCHPPLGRYHRTARHRARSPGQRLSYNTISRGLGGDIADDVIANRALSKAQAFSILALVSGLRSFSFGTFGSPAGLGRLQSATRDVRKSRGGLCTHPVPTAAYGHLVPTYGMIGLQIKVLPWVLVESLWVGLVGTIPDIVEWWGDKTAQAVR
jgi:hypothetical protein